MDATKRTPEKTKMKKAKLSKTIAAKEKKTPLQSGRSAGKRRPKSEPRITKGLQGPPKEDLLAKRLLFLEEDDEDDQVGKGQSVKVVAKKQKQKTPRRSSSSDSSRGKEREYHSTSSWKVTAAQGKDAKPKTKKVMETEKMKSKEPLHQDSINDDDDDDDVEIDFPKIKRKSLGTKPSNLPPKSENLLKAKKRTVLGEKGQNGQEERMGPCDSSQKMRGKKKGSTKDVQVDKTKRQQMEDQAAKSQSGGDASPEKKKRRKRNREKKRRRTDSEKEEEPPAKKEKSDDEFLVRCGNLPAGVTAELLRMFVNEADIFPTSIKFKCKRKMDVGEKKRFIKYATIHCSSEGEVNKLCELNGLAMPSLAGGMERKLLIHRMNAGNKVVLPSMTKLYIKNLHPLTTEGELRQFFEDNKLHPTNVSIPKKGKSHRSKGYALVWLETVGDIGRAIGLKKGTLRDQTFTIARANTTS